MTDILANIDAKTKARAADMAAYELEDQLIADSLMISLDQVLAIKETSEYKHAFALRLAERVQGQIDRTEGWDAVEEAGISRVLQVLQKSVDPQFALQAAAVANKAKRVERRNPTINARGASGGVVILTLNKTYVNRIQTSTQEPSNQLVEGKVVPLEQKRSDLPTPKRVAEMLNVSAKITQGVRSEMASQMVDEFEKSLEMDGIDPSFLDDTN